MDWETRTANTDYKARTAHTDYKTKVANTDYKAIGEKNSKPILQLNKDTMEVVKEWKSAMDAQRNGGFENSGICNCLKGRLKTHKGFIWKYKNGEAC